MALRSLRGVGLGLAGWLLLGEVPALAAGEPCTTSQQCGTESCVAGVCIDPYHPAASEPEPRFQGFVGFTTLGGPALGGVLSTGGVFDSALRATFLGAIEGGVLLGDHEIAVEISPYAYAYYANSPGPTFEANVSYAYLFPLARDHGTSFAWPLRVGVGFFTGNTGGDVYAQLRVDVIGLMIRTRRFILDIHAPSFRYAISSVGGVTPNLLSWEFGLSGAFPF
jgi:hypothetical protein